MSFRHTYITEYLYKHGRKNELQEIENALEKYGTVSWCPSSNDNELGYFHGVIKDLDSFSTKEEEKEIVNAIEKSGARIKIVFE